MQIARIKISCINIQKLDEVCNEIKRMAEKYGVSFRGPSPLPTKKLKIPVMRTPCGSGTGHGNATWDKYEMRIHKRILDIGANERVLHQIMRMNISSDIQLSIELKN